MAYACKFFGPWIETHRQEIKQVLMLLVVPPETAIQRYARLYSEGDFLGELGRTFRTAFLHLYQMPPGPALVPLVEAGLTALKTRSCFCIDSAPFQEDLREEYEDPALTAASLGRKRNPDCPVCTGPLQPITRDLPYAHFERTHLVCRLTGEPMDPDNPPMVLPNGQAYSLKVTGCDVICF